MLGLLTLASGLKLALVYKQISQVRSPYHYNHPPVNLQALLMCFVMHDILCNGPKFEVLYGKHIKFTKKKGKYYCRRQNITFSGLSCSNVC